MRGVSPRVPPATARASCSREHFTSAPPGRESTLLVAPGSTIATHPALQIPPPRAGARSRSGTGIRAPSDGAASCTSRQQNAHVTESRVVLYRWHPWHSRPVFVFGAVTKGEQAVFRCALERADVARPLEVPQWMFDAAACCRIALAATPSVSVEALRELDQLLSAVKPAEQADVLQAEHFPLPDLGGACATGKRSTIARSAGAVSSAAEDDRLKREATALERKHGDVHPGLP